LYTNDKNIAIPLNKIVGERNIYFWFIEFGEMPGAAVLAQSGQ
jgi:hypothetical protein